MNDNAKKIIDVAKAETDKAAGIVAEAVHVKARVTHTLPVKYPNFERRSDRPKVMYVVKGQTVESPMADYLIALGVAEPIEDKPAATPPRPKTKDTKPSN